MYEHMTFEAILESMLASVSDSYDKREGSVIYNALAPAAAQLAQAYIALEATADRGFADTATGSDLDKKAAERGLTRNAATFAVRRGEFFGASGAYMDITTGLRFSGGGLVFAVTERIGTGIFKLTCETAGEAGNLYFGTLLPIEYVSGLGSAVLSDVLIAGENEEGDASLRARYYLNISSQAFGGNVADYKAKVNAIAGVGGVKVTPAWNGGGTVKLTVISSEYGVPSNELISLIKATIDPGENEGEGFGLAPIGHVVTVEAVSGTVIDIASDIALSSGFIWADVETYIREAIAGYLSELAESWADSAQIYVRVSWVEQAILSVSGVMDVQGTTINGEAANLALDANTIPILGAVAQL